MSCGIRTRASVVLPKHNARAPFLIGTPAPNGASSASETTCSPSRGLCLPPPHSGLTPADRRSARHVKPARSLRPSRTLFMTPAVLAMTFPFKEDRIPKAPPKRRQGAARAASDKGDCRTLQNH